MMNWLKSLLPLILVHLFKKRYYDAKIKHIENKIPSIVNLASTTGLIAVENKIPDISTLVKKADYND